MVNFKRMEELTKLQTQLEDLTTKQSDLEMQVQHDPMKLEAVRLCGRLSEVIVLQINLSGIAVIL